MGQQLLVESRVNILLVYRGNHVEYLRAADNANVSLSVLVLRRSDEITPDSEP